MYASEGRSHDGLSDPSLSGRSYKEVFTLKVLGELNYKEIAQIFGKQETWARVTYHRARVKIQDILERRST